jgi:glucokinase
VNNTTDSAVVVAGIDIGATKQSLVLARPDGTFVHRDRRASPPAADRATLFAGIAQMLAGALAQAAAQGLRVAAVGVGFGGPVDAHTGTVQTSHHVPGWSGFPLQPALAAHSGLPVVVDNDARAGALGEFRFGAGRGHRNMVYVNIGTGVGGGLVLDGRLYRGPTTTAGEIGHLRILPDGPPCPCGGQGCLEALAAGPAIARRARTAVAADPTAGAALRQAAGGDPAAVSSRHVFAVAAQGDTLAQRLVAETASYLALATTSLVNLLNPTAVVFGGGVAEVGEALLMPIRDRVLRWALPAPARVVSILPAALGYDAGVAGAAALALEACTLRQPAAVT